MAEKEENESLDFLEDNNKEKKRSLKEITSNILKFDESLSNATKDEDKIDNNIYNGDLSLQGTLKLLKYDKTNDIEEESNSIDLLENITERFQISSSLSEESLMTIRDIKEDILENNTNINHLKIISELLSILRRKEVTVEEIELLLNKELSIEWQRIIDKSLIVFSLEI